MLLKLDIGYLVYETKLYYKMGTWYPKSKSDYMNTKPRLFGFGGVEFCKYLTHVNTLKFHIFLLNYFTIHKH